jgi:hypothetical protein
MKILKFLIQYDKDLFLLSLNIYQFLNKKKLSTENIQQLNDFEKEL